MSVSKINQKTVAEARRNRADRMRREQGVDLDPRKIPNTDLVFRVMSWENIPLIPKKQPKSATNRKVKLQELFEIDEENNDDGLDDLLDDVVADSVHQRVNFPPFVHYRIDTDRRPYLVGKSHWRGDLHTGGFSKDHGNMTRRLAEMLMKLCERYATRSNWRGYTYNEEMRGQALLQLSQIGLQFDESKSQNPFAYYTAAITNSFTRVLNIEKKNQNIRDDILEMNGLNPSWSRQYANVDRPKTVESPVEE